MDLSNLKPRTDDITVNLKHPVSGEDLMNDDNTPMTITLTSPYSKQYRGTLHELSQSEATKYKDKPDVELTYEIIHNFSVDLLGKITKDWNITLNGKKPKLTLKVARSLYDEYTWVKEQVEAEINGAEAFTQD